MFHFQSYDHFLFYFFAYLLSTFLHTTSISRLHKKKRIFFSPGKGTSARDGSALAGALLENLEEKKVAGIFATHLHELFMLPLLIPTTKYKRMGSEMKSDGKHYFVYFL